MNIAKLLEKKKDDFKETFQIDSIVNIIVEYKKAFIIFILILLFTFLRNKYIMKSSKSMTISKKNYNFK